MVQDISLTNTFIHCMYTWGYRIYLFDGTVEYEPYTENETIVIYCNSQGNITIFHILEI